MRFWTLCLNLCAATLCGCSAASAPASDGGVWTRLPAVTSDRQYGLGVSAPFVGLLNGEVIVAGGCNFPEAPAAEGGTKRFYADVFALDTSGAAWRKVGMLPQALAYGAYASVAEGVICAGGTDSTGRPVRDVFLLGGAGITSLVSIPRPLDNCAGAFLDGRFYVAGNRAFYIYDFAADDWREGLLWPGAERRVQPVLAAQAGKIWLFGGYDPDGPKFVTGTGYVFDPATDSWEAVAGPVDENGLPLLAAGGAGAAWGTDSIVCFGGVNAAVFTEALQRGQRLAGEPGNDSLRAAQRDYMEQEAEWYRFNDRVLIYNTATGIWTVSATPAPQSARAGAVAVSLPGRGGIVLFNGELKPGVRTPEVWRWRP